jgi:hypothetical protein
MMVLNYHFYGGMWRSLVAHFVRDEGAAGSNPVIPIVYLSLAKLNGLVAKLLSVLPNSSKLADEN